MESGLRARRVSARSKQPSERLNAVEMLMFGYPISFTVGDAQPGNQPAGKSES